MSHRSRGSVDSVPSTTVCIANRYLTHFDVFYSTCTMSDSRRMAKPVDGTEGRRLSYKRVKDR